MVRTIESTTGQSTAARRLAILALGQCNPCRPDGRLQAVPAVRAVLARITRGLVAPIPLTPNLMTKLKQVCKWGGIVLLLVLLFGGAASYVWWQAKYRATDEMEIAVTEFRPDKYPADPAPRSVHYSAYNGRKLRLIRRDKTRFDFVFEPASEDTDYLATITFKDIDVGLMTPGQPEWTKDDDNLETIALVDRQWNRQQVSFPPDSEHVEITGGDGFEKQHMHSLALSKNCLNAGLWEVLLFEKVDDGKEMYYQGWFDFPLGHYREIVEHNADVDYRDHWYRLEHWWDPTGTPVDLGKLREVVAEKSADFKFDPEEPLIVHGEQVRKRRTLDSENIRTWADFFDGKKVRFASFIPPGYYDFDAPRQNEYERMAKFQGGTLRKVRAEGGSEPLHEIELVFKHRTKDERLRFIVGGVDLLALAQLPIEQYPNGLYMPMGIGVPPFYQSYEELKEAPPTESPYYSVLLDDNARWIDHHAVGVDGPVMHLDADDPHKLHLYLLSYERHTLIGHFVISISELVEEPADDDAQEE